ncbi:P-loop containing nucleoside triphosphate hydrolase protein [Xylaria cf. heliscus]|nr:P-loop containing nucleoside triphosphate hydrolase protein [Xylaria cf. heliscus]
MEQMESVSQWPAKDKPKYPWIRYRVEHRDRITNEMLSHRDTREPGPHEVSFNDAGSSAAFMLLTTYMTGKSSPVAASSQALNRSFSPVTSPPSYSIHLYSPAIVHALRSVVQYYPSQDLTGDIVIKWPYAILVHHYDELVRFRDSVAQKDEIDTCEREQGACEDLSLLLEYLDRSIMPEVLQERGRNAQGYWTFEYMWVLLQPGTTILLELSEDSNLHPKVIYSMDGGSFQHPPVAWSVWAWDMRYDAEYLGRYKASITFEKWDGLKEIKVTIVGGNLENRDNMSRVVSNQISYGETYWRLLRGKCQQYKGKSQSYPSKEVDGLVMADMKSYYSSTLDTPDLMDTTDCRNLMSDCKCKVCKTKTADNKNCSNMVSLFEDYNLIKVEKRDTLTAHQYFLCSFDIPAFVFKTQTWEHLHARGFSEPKFDESLVDHLVMEHQRKQMLKALVKCYTRCARNGEPLEGEPWTADFIQGKGHGLIFLLHGRPGVGKTYTAECIAAFTRRPLMVLTSSDIGIRPEDVEINLTKHFTAARNWGVVLLIDQADIFMERRSTGDLHRNSLVAAFLRALEFYDGILFLTTNRVGSFDDAFISRVHIQLYYPDFDDNQRQQIWQTFANKLAKERGDYMRLNIDAKDYIRGSEMRALKWNGREIRNAFQTAVLLAEYDAWKGEDGKIIITDEHLRAVVELSRDFKTYLNELHRGDEAKRAERKYERLDSYAPS